MGRGDGLAWAFKRTSSVLDEKWRGLTEYACRISGLSFCIAWRYIPLAA